MHWFRSRTESGILVASGAMDALEAPLRAAGIPNERSGPASRLVVLQLEMRFSRREFLQFLQFLPLAAGAAALPALHRPAQAQVYPSRPVRIIVGVPPGGSPDIQARLIGQWLSERLGQPFLVENRPGGGTNIATESVVRAPADGHTLLLVTASIPGTPPSTTSSISISSATSRRSRASIARPS